MKRDRKTFLDALEDSIEELSGVAAVVAVALVAVSVAFFAMTMIEREAGAVIATAVELQQSGARP